MYLVFKMFTVIPVTSCTCERVFFKLSIVKNKLRCTIYQDRLELLLLIFTEQELACKLDINEITDEFKNVVPFERRLSL